MAMLYRHHVEFGVGHGVSIHAECPEGVCDKAHRLSTVVVPTHEVPRTTPPTVADWPRLAGLVVDMKELGETPTPQLAAKLRPLLTAYAAWIDDRQADLANPDMAPYQTPGQTALGRCREALRRIEAGLTLLAEDENAAEAFRFANLAMWQQRVHSMISLRKRRDEPVDERAIDVPANRSWYPFQLAFLLLNLPGITRLDHKDRSDSAEAIADLLWFPTGGGKTEAYLGLSAYTMALRRLQGPVAGRSGEQGIAVLMRYTLRLLTIQQFQRAAALICACEVIRRGDEKKWGKEPFRIGLWVGQKTTPNTTDQAAEAIQQEHGGKYKGRGSGSPAQLTNCPWCGAKIQPGPRHQGRELRQGPMPHRHLLRRRARPLPVQRQELAAGGRPGRRGGRGDLPPPADSPDRHGGQVRPDAVERQGPDALRAGRGLLRPPWLPLARDRGRRLATPRRTSTPRPRRHRTRCCARPT